MTEAKTQITGVDPQKFISLVEPEAKREDAMALDALFRKVTGERPQMWGPSSIGYGVYNTVVTKFKLSIEEPVYDPEMKPRGDFFT